MCGICGGWRAPADRGVQAMIHRGPDGQATVSIGPWTLGHARLAIVDPTSRSDQPFVYGGTTLVYNGELWNYRQLRDQLAAEGCGFTTSGDTEVVAAALDTWGPDKALRRMQGMFAIAWIKDGELYIARDRFGEVPLHVARQFPFMFASEIKALLAMGASPRAVEWFPPGSWARVVENGIFSTTYHDLTHHEEQPDQPMVTLSAAANRLRQLVGLGTTERIMADVPVCTLLSGGIDSTVVAYFLAQHYPNLTAYTAVLDPRSPDLRAARLAADSMGLQLVEVPVSAPTADDLGEVVRLIEMPHKAQVEIGWACLQLADRMKADGFKVTYSGEGSDELWGSYGFAYHGIAEKGWYRFRRELFVDQHRKNFSRCNKIFLSRSVECRLPFLCTSLVEYALSLPEFAVRSGKGHPKAVLQRAFAELIPDAVINRSKLAFQDGMGLKQVIADALPNARTYYSAVHRASFRGVTA